MARRQLRTYSATFKARVAVAVLRGDKTIAEIAEKYAGSGQCDKFCSKISVLAGLLTMP
jgi:transposase-like protein